LSQVEQGSQGLDVLHIEYGEQSVGRVQDNRKPTRWLQQMQHHDVSRIIRTLTSVIGSGSEEGHKHTELSLLIDYQPTRCSMVVEPIVRRRSSTCGHEQTRERAPSHRLDYCSAAQDRVALWVSEATATSNVEYSLDGCAGIVSAVLVLPGSCWSGTRLLCWYYFSVGSMSHGH